MQTSYETEGPEGAVTYAPTSLETPFLEVYPGDLSSGRPARAPEGPVETPFLSEYLLGDEVVGGSSDGYRELLADLFDGEFDETFADLVDEADARAQLLGLDEAGADTARVERALQHWLEPLRTEAEDLLEQMGDALAARGAEMLDDSEVDRLLQGLEPIGAGGNPVFEDFLRKVWNKAKRAAKGAVKLAKKGIAAVGKVLPIGVLLKQLKALIRPLLTRVLKMAMDKLPPALRPAAAQLAKRFLGVGELEFVESAETDVGPRSPASADIRSLQVDFDAEVAALLLAPDTPELESLVAEAEVRAERLEDASIPDLGRAREQFVQQLSALEEGEDPTPLVEQFLPAVLPALRVGIGIVGRPKVVGFLAKLLGRLIAPYVGPQLSAPLSRAIADAGLRLMTLEAGEDEEASSDGRVAAEAFAALVEDTVARVAELEEDEAEDEGVVEEVALEGFARAARSAFPASVLRRGGHPKGVWVGMPRRGPRRYRKWSQVFDITIPPEAAALVKTRDGRTLETFLRDRLGRTGPVRARIHLYQAVPGTRLSRIARAERAVPGLGPGAVAARTELHPLTREAAGALLADPELGQDVAEAFLDELAPPAVGQRFYYLEVPGGRPAVATPGRTHARLSTTTAAVDLRTEEVRVALYLAEAAAQDLAARLRRREPLGALLTSLRPVYAGALRSLATPGGRRRLLVVGEASVPTTEEMLGIPGLPNPAGALGKLLSRWTRSALASQLLGRRDAVLAAAAAPAEGVTLLIRLARPPGLPLLAKVARGGAGAILRSPGSWKQLLGARPAAATVEVVAGFRRA